MIIFRNEKLIKRNARIGTILAFAAVLILGVGMYISMRYQNLDLYLIAALFVGFTVSQIGLFYINRFGRKPRLDEVIDNALKGLDDRYALYHYQSPVPHLLVGPAGLWILFAYPLKGKIHYDQKKKSWKQRGGNLFLKLFGQEGLGNPARDMKSARNRLQKDLERIPQFTPPEIKSALVFTDPEVVVKADQAPLPTLHASQLKKLIRKEAKGSSPLPTYSVKTIRDYYGSETAG
jgi:hypothetical protein